MTTKVSTRSPATQALALVCDHFAAIGHDTLRLQMYSDSLGALHVCTSLDQKVHIWLGVDQRDDLSTYYVDFYIAGDAIFWCNSDVLTAARNKDDAQCMRGVDLCKLLGTRDPFDRCEGNKVRKLAYFTGMPNVDAIAANMIAALDALSAIVPIFPHSTVLRAS